MWTKAKTLGLTTKNRLKITKILIFILKLIPFTDIDNNKTLFDKCYKYYETGEDNYLKLLSYYKKNWLNKIILIILN